MHERALEAARVRPEAAHLLDFGSGKSDGRCGLRRIVLHPPSPSMTACGSITDIYRRRIYTNLYKFVISKHRRAAHPKAPGKQQPEGEGLHRAVQLAARVEGWHKMDEERGGQVDLHALFVTAFEVLDQGLQPSKARVGTFLPCCSQSFFPPFF